jgi:hypothetical protein
MTSRRDDRDDGHFADELDDLIQGALCESVGLVQPPACVWGEIRRKVQCRNRKGTGWYAGGDSFYRPTGAFSVWEGHVSLSLAYIIEQQMPILRVVGWAT